MQELKFIGAKMPPYTLGRVVALFESGKIDYNGIVSYMMSLAKRKS